MKILRFIESYWKRKGFYERRKTEKNYKIENEKTENLENFNSFIYTIYLIKWIVYFLL